MCTADNEWMTIKQVCEELTINRSTMDMWRRLKTAPEFIRLPNASLRTRRSTLNAWLDSREVA